ncbi:MAG: rod shape-determining protein [Halanaerobiales bacterium]|nr:rod shape-determining protein [Halanaerobiales bacterium]
MDFLKNIFTNKRTGDFSYRLVLDIGTEYLKAAMIEFNQTERNILGFGRVRQDYGNMDGGAITNINGVVKKARQAIAKISQTTPHQAKDLICGIAGEFVKGILVSQERERNNSAKRIDQRELEQLINQGQEIAYQRAVRKVEQETGLSGIKLELINHSIVEVKVDGYRVNDPEQFQGSNLNLTVFYSFAPFVQIGALRTIARQLGYKLTATVAEPFAVASSINKIESYEFGAIIIDIGGGTTDIALLRNGGIEGTRMFAMGGRAFTRTLAKNLNISLRAAEKLKLAYTRGEELDNYRQIDYLLKGDLQIIYQGIELSLHELANGELLPGYIFFCGGGSALKGLVENFARLNLTEKLPLLQKPVIKVLDGADLKGITDQTGLLKNVEHTTPRALSYYGAGIKSKERSMIYLEG